MTTTAYRRYLIKQGFDGMFHVSRDGHHIGTFATLAAAKAGIDEISFD